MKIDRIVGNQICEIDLSNMTRQEVIALKREVELDARSVSDSIEIALRTRSTAAGLRKLQRAKRALVVQLRTTEARLSEIKRGEREAHQKAHDKLMTEKRDIREIERRIQAKNSRTETFERLFLRQAEVILPRGTFNHIADCVRLLMPKE